MIYSLPADVVVFSLDGIPTGLVGSGTPIGVQVLRASNGTVVLPRTEEGIDETPAGSGIYVFTLTAAPAEEDTYLIVADWSAGVATPDTSRSEEMSVAATIPVIATELGPIADACKTHFGTTFDRLKASNHYGAAYILRAIEAVKNRTLKAPPATAAESTLHPVIIDYLGKLATIELIPAAYDYWASQLQTETTGNDSTETISYPDRMRMLENLLEEMLRQTRRDEPIVDSLIEAPIALQAALVGPAIDEIDDCKVTTDPRNFPNFAGYPGGHPVRTGRRW